MAYTDITFFQTYTRTTYSPTTTPTDTEVQLFLDMAKAEIDELTGRDWEQHTAVETIHNPSNGLILLSDTPVIGEITSIVDENGDDVAFEQIDRDFIQLTSSLPTKIVVTHEAGYVNVPTAIVMLNILYTIRALKQSESTTAGNSESITLGPISITNAIGTSAVIGLDSSIEKFERRIRRFII